MTGRPSRPPSRHGHERDHARVDRLAVTIPDLASYLRIEEPSSRRRSAQGRKLISPAWVNC
jgi:hypothetical protein